uniref:Uncharacterized protein n=1 Tax=Oryza sativa subsp. japonica TaxID=39947 RepID=Q6ZL63_ORYSJ|nr:hypothetical protein [Oryza sativa Japonica Group]
MDISRTNEGYTSCGPVVEMSWHRVGALLLGAQSYRPVPEVPAERAGLLHVAAVEGVDSAGGGSPYTDPAAVAVNARILRWQPSPHGSGSQPPSPHVGSSSPPLPFLPSLDPAEGRGDGGVVAGGELGSDGGWRGGRREAGGTMAVGRKPTAGF